MKLSGPALSRKSNLADIIRVTLLGTGTPFPNVERFGSAILVEAAREKLLFDCGRGAVIRLSHAGKPANEVDALFLTHLHSDHVVGIADLWLTGWFLGRDHPLRIWGPPGTSTMIDHLSQAYQFDVQTREHSSESLPPKGAEIDVGKSNKPRLTFMVLCGYPPFSSITAR